MKTWVMVASFALAGCSVATDPTRVVAEVRGIWTYSGTQASPPATLTGTLNIAQQAGEVIEGSLSWTEADGVNMPVLRSGAMAGIVVASTDVDFEVGLDGASRRHLARISANGDTLVGVWTTVGGGASGNFTAIRSEP